MWAGPSGRSGELLGCCTTGQRGRRGGIDHADLDQPEARRRVPRHPLPRSARHLFACFVHLQDPLGCKSHLVAREEPERVTRRQTVMTRTPLQGVLRGFCCLGVVAGAAACSSTTTHHYSVTGIVRGYGGPEIVVNGKGHSAMNGAPMKNQLVTVRRSDGSTTSVRTGATGRFSISLQPGQYTVSPSCGLPVHLTVQASNPAPLALRCDFP